LTVARYWLTADALLSLPVVAQGVTRISPKENQDHTGEIRTLCGFVFYILIDMITLNLTTVSETRLMRDNHENRFLVPRHGPARVKIAADVSENQLHHWFSRNLLELTYKGHGHGKRRMFTGLEAVRLAIMSSLDHQGIGIKKARDIAIAVTAPIEQGKGIPEDAIECVFSGDGASIKGARPIGDWSDDLWHARLQDPREILEGDEWLASIVVISFGRTVGEVLHALEQDLLEQEMIELEGGD